MTILIGLAGPAGVGKDTVGNRLYYMHGFINTSFAEPLRIAASEIFGIDYNHFTDRELKDSVVEYWGMTPRQMIQRLGTEGVRGTFGEDFWLKRWKMVKETAGMSRVVVTDVRFLNEAAMIREMGGKIVHMLRPDLEPVEGNHASGQGIPFLAGDYILDNDGDLKGLYEKVDALLRELS